VSAFLTLGSNLHKHLIVVLIFVLVLGACTTPGSVVRTTPGSARDKIVSSEPKMRVLIADKISQLNIRLNGEFFLEAPEGKYKFSDKSGIISLEKINSGFQVQSRARMLRFRSDVVAALRPVDKNSYATVNNVSYRGTLRLFLEQGELRIINVIALEQYLEGVVPSEIPVGRNVAYEAIKAQSVAARTYALRAMNDKKHKSFDVYADHRDQVYLGLLKNTKLANQAIAETRGKALFYRDKPIEAKYFSTAGGLTEDFAEVWGDTSRPYLTVKPNYKGEILDADSPFYRWQKSFSAQQLENRFRRWLNQDALQPDNDLYYEPRQYSIRVLSRTQGKRIRQLSVSDGSNEIILKAGDIRRFFSDDNGRLLPSTLFNMQLLNGEVTLTGGGFGHGVGMCQYGALKLSEKATDFEDILNFYYPGTDLIKVY
jgi:stage II sporulation protein D